MWAFVLLQNFLILLFYRRHKLSALLKTKNKQFFITNFVSHKKEKEKNATSQKFILKNFFFIVNSKV